MKFSENSWKTIKNRMCMSLSIYTYTGLWGMQYTTLRQAAWWNYGCGFDRRLRAHDNDERPIMQAIFCGISRICKNSKLDGVPTPICLQLHINATTHEGRLISSRERCSVPTAESRDPSSKERSTKPCKKTVFGSLATFIMDLLIYGYI